MTVKPDGTPVVKPSQDSTQKAKAKVQKKAAPESTKTEGERKKAATLDAAMLGAYKAKIALLARQAEGGKFADLVAGSEMLFALATGMVPALADDASEAVKAAHAALFAPKA